jgi:2-polyprenyl-6-methoxyphenol hydroxylase-like FAD-dependent oxidoreductase
MIRVSRRRMRALCSEGLIIKYGKTLTDIAYGANGTGVTAHFADGTTAKGDILIGADGPRSKVRELLLGTEKAKTKTLGLNFNSFLVKYDDAEKSKHVRSNHPITCLAYHPDGIFSFISGTTNFPQFRSRLPHSNRPEQRLTAPLVYEVPDTSSPETWSFQLACSWFGERESSLATVNQKMKSFAEPFRSAFAWIPQGTSPNNGAIRYWVPISWDNHEGRATLVGDAAHPLPPRKLSSIPSAFFCGTKLIQGRSWTGTQCLHLRRLRILRYNNKNSSRKGQFGRSDWVVRCRFGEARRGRS